MIGSNYNFSGTIPTKPLHLSPKWVEAAAKAEPGADRDMVVVKNVNTRFGMSRTTGTALIYGSAESKSIEPEYVIERHSSRADSATEENAVSEEEGSIPEESEGQPEDSEEGDA